ncbi:MAG: polysaccharide biosynthesis/export family protein, partial [Gemmatimonadetes bacterium]|nr:polysaccharide biosynthesis/export family protein [Gemmatimonadota bacterium]
MLRLLVVLIAALGLLASPARTQQAAPAGTGGGVTLRPGDLIRVAVWREEDLSGEFPVNERGIVVLPLLGEREVTGIPIERLRDVLLEEYRKQLRNPSIQITPLRRVVVLGEVAKPGLQEVDPTITLAGAIALAGGPTPLGDMRRIRIVREGTVLQDRAAMETKLSSIDIRSGDQIFVGSRSWLER